MHLDRVALVVQPDADDLAGVRNARGEPQILQIEHRPVAHRTTAAEHVVEGEVAGVPYLVGCRDR